MADDFDFSRLNIGSGQDGQEEMPDFSDIDMPEIRPIYICTQCGQPKARVDDSTGICAPCNRENLRRPIKVLDSTRSAIAAKSRVVGTCLRDIEISKRRLEKEVNNANVLSWQAGNILRDSANVMHSASHLPAPFSPGSSGWSAPRPATRAQLAAAFCFPAQRGAHAQGVLGLGAPVQGVLGLGAPVQRALAPGAQRALAPGVPVQGVLALGAPGRQQLPHGLPPGPQRASVGPGRFVNAPHVHAHARAVFPRGDRF